MKKICWLIALLLCLCLCFASASADIVPYARAKNADRVRLCGAPSFRFKPVATLANRNTVAVHSEMKSGWSFVSTPTISGYAPSEYLHLGQTQSSVPAADGRGFFNKGSDAERYRAVLSGESTFFNLDTNTVQYAENVLEPDTPGSYFSGFALADFDGDGALEVAARIGEDYGVLILDCYANGVTGCTMFYRAFQQPKADGTFSYASSAAESGFAHIRLEPDGVHSVNLVFSFVDNAGDIGYEVYGRRATEASFREALDEQEAKPDIVWHPLSSLSELLR